MLWEKTEALLKEKGFHILLSNITPVTMFYKPQGEDAVKICLVVKNENGIRFDSTQLEAMRFQLDRKFLLEGYRDINIMYIIFTDHPEDGKEFVNSSIRFWLVDTLVKRLIIYESQPDEFENMRDSLEESLQKREWIKTGLLKQLPFINIGIVFVNVIAFLITSFDKDDSILNLGVSYGPYIIDQHEYYRLITCMFVHFNISHLLNNMITLLIVGNVVEKSVGKGKYLLLYFLSGLGSSIISVLYYYGNDMSVASGGASGAIFGVLGVMFVILYKNRHRIQDLMGLRFFIMIAMCLYNGFVSPEVDNAAHIAGLVVGLILASVLYHPGKDNEIFERRN